MTVVPVPGALIKREEAQNTKLSFLSLWWQVAITSNFSQLQPEDLKKKPQTTLAGARRLKQKTSPAASSQQGDYLFTSGI